MCIDVSRTLRSFTGSLVSYLFIISFVRIQIMLYDEQNTFHANTELRVTDNMLFYNWLQS